MSCPTRRSQRNGWHCFCKSSATLVHASLWRHAQVSSKLREGPSQGLAEFVATFGLVGAILGSLRFRADATPWIVGLYITAAYWFTASTSFANPAETLARGFTNTFAGIELNHVLPFIAAQLIGASLAVLADLGLMHVKT